jgi:purine-binding chemotaxis protein CheW
LAKDVDHIKRYLTFSLAQECYGLAIEKVREIIAYIPITKVPNTGEFIKGIINLRGKIIPVLSLRGKFNIEEIATNKHTCIIVVDLEDTLIGMIVDTVDEVIDLPSSAIEKPPRLSSKDTQGYLEGLAKLSDRVLILLDVTKILAPSKIDDFIDFNQTSLESVA